MDNDTQPQNNQNVSQPSPDTIPAQDVNPVNDQPRPDAFSAQGTNPTNVTPLTATTSQPLMSDSPQVISSSNPAEVGASETKKSEIFHNIGRALLALGILALIAGAIVAVLYFMKAGIFGEKRVSTGNHSFTINENDWKINEVEESDYLITLSREGDEALLTISDHPILSNYKYDDPSVAKALGVFGSTSSDKRTFGNTSCVVYDTNMNYKGVNIEMKSALCNVNGDYNAIVGIASRDDSILEKYLSEGIKIVQTGKK